MSQEAVLPPLLADVLHGLVAVHLIRLGQPGELARAYTQAVAEDGLADVIAEAGDRLTAPGNFRDPEDRRKRGQLLTSMATCLAIGAQKPGGITWAGHHWCTTPHPDCPNTRTEN